MTDLALYPQFVPDDRPFFATTAALGVVEVAVECCGYGVLALGGWRADSCSVGRHGVRLALGDR